MEQDPFPDGGDIYMLDLDDETIPLIQQNDPDVTGLWVHMVSEDEQQEGFIGDNFDWANAGRQVGENTHLEKVTISSFNGEVEGAPTDQDFQDFCTGLARNRSIRSIKLHQCTITVDLFAILFQFLVHNTGLCE